MEWKVLPSPKLGTGEGEGQLGFLVGESLRIEEECEGWYYGLHLESNRRGMFPISFVRIKPAEQKNIVSSEVIQVLREWEGLLLKLFKDRKMKEYRLLSETVLMLLDLHKKFVSSPTETKRKEVEERIISKLEEGRRQLGLDVILRGPAGNDSATLSNVGVIPLYNLHKEVADKDRKEARRFRNTISPSATLTEENLYLHLDMKIFMCSVGEPTELYFSLYNKDQEKFISEEYSVQLTGNGMPFDVEKIGKLKVLFPLVSKDLSQLYLVCRLLRRGKLLYENKKEKKAGEYRRPFGGSLLYLDDEKLMQISAKETEFTLPVYSPLQEHQFSNIHELIIKKTGIQEVPRAKGICVGLWIVRPAQLEASAELQKVERINRATPESLMLENKNDIYVTFLESEVNQDRKTSAKNVEAILQVITDTGEQVRDCIYLGLEKKSEYRTYITYHSNTPKWHETIRISIPDQPCHLNIMIRHCSTSESKEKAPFSAAFLPLYNPDGTGCRDEVHTLTCYKPPKVADPVFYLKDKKEVRKNEFIKLKTTLVSSKITQNSALLSLWKWQNLNPQTLNEVLKQLTYVNQKELVRFLPETFNALFSLLEVEGKNGVALPVYNAIAFLIGYLIDEKKAGANFRPILDNYINQQFHAENAHKHLINCLKHLFDKIKEEGPTKIIPTLKALDYIFKFVIASRKKFNQTQVIKEDMWFKHDLREVFDSFYQLMSSTSSNFTGAQNIALKNVAAMFQDLGQIFEIQELSDIAKKFLQSIQYTEGTKLRNKEKLNLLQKMVSSDLFVQKESRNEILPIVVQNLKIHITAEELDLCISILCVLLERLQTIIHTTEPISQLISLLPEFLTVLNQQTLLPSARLDLTTCFFTTLFLMEYDHFYKFFDTLDDQSKTSLLSKLTKIMKEFLSTSSTFPENWFALRLLPYITAKKVLVVVSTILKKRVSLLKSTGEAVDQEKQIWSDLFKICILILKSSILAIESCGEAKRKIIEESTKVDIRIEVGTIFQQVWDVFDTTSISYEFIDQLIGPLLELMLINQPNVQQVSTELYFKNLARSFKQDKNFVKVENLTIYTADRLINDGSAREPFRVLFQSSLQSKFTGNDEFSNKGKSFLQDINEFLSLLLKRKEAESVYEDDRLYKTLQFMEYLKRTGRLSHYLKYVHLLCEQNLSFGNYTEAGFTLLLHANLLNWSDEMVPEEGDFPAQPQRQRKEKLYSTAIEYFDKGKNWEKAIDLIKELRTQYETVLFNYPALAATLRMEASFFKKIMANERFFPPYFMVGYYGKDFDAVLRGKQFIHKGFELEGTSDFITRLRGIFPQAEILKLNDTQPSEYNDKPDLHVLAVKASNKSAMEGNFSNPFDPNMPPHVQSYYASNNTNIFLFSQPFKKSVASPASSRSNNPYGFKDEWIRNCFFITEDMFPTVHRRTIVIKTAEVLANPVDNVVTSLQEKSRELWDIINKYEVDKESSQLTTVLRGAIESKVLLTYREAFLNEAYLKENPQHKPSLIRLQGVIVRLIEILESGIVLHAKVTEDPSLQENLSSQFVKMKEELTRPFNLN